MAFIPEKHAEYNLLSRWKEFELIVEDWKLKDQLCSRFGAEKIERVFHSLDDAVAYYENFKSTIWQPYRIPVVKMIDEYIADIKKKNCKEFWSVVKYRGTGYEAYNTFERGRYYYMPCIESEDVFLGILDDDGDLVNWIPTTYDNWEVIDDPTGTAARVMSGEINGATENDYQENLLVMEEMVRLLRQSDFFY